MNQAPKGAAATQVLLTAMQYPNDACCRHYDIADDMYYHRHSLRGVISYQYAAEYRAKGSDERDTARRRVYLGASCHGVEAPHQDLCPHQSQLSPCT